MGADGSSRPIPHPVLRAPSTGPTASATPFSVCYALFPSTEPFSPGGPPDWRGSARWCGKDWVGWGWCARGPVRDSVF